MTAALPKQGPLVTRRASRLHALAARLGSNAMESMVTATLESAALAPLPEARLTGSILVVGLGSVGLRHARNLRALGHDVLVQRSGLGTLAHEDLGVRQHRDLDSALAARPVAAIVANPTSMHLETALRLARAGTHLLVEKPLSHEAHGVAELRQLVEEKQLVAQVGFQLRFHPTLQRVKAWIDEGAIGRVVSVHVHWSEWLGGWHPWEDYRRSYSARRALGGGVLRTLCHPFDYLRWLLGEVEWVAAEADRLSGLDLDVEDTALVTLRFASGAIGSVYVDYVGRPRRHRMEVVGRSGRIAWDAERGVAELHEGDTTAPLLVLPPAGFHRNQLFLDEVRAFLGRVRGGHAELDPLDDGIRALAITLAAVRAAETGCRVRP
jgi:predicted dehydrogenase